MSDLEDRVRKGMQNINCPLWNYCNDKPAKCKDCEYNLVRHRFRPVAPSLGAEE